MIFVTVTDVRNTNMQVMEVWGRGLAAELWTGREGESGHFPTKKVYKFFQAVLGRDSLLSEGS